MRKPLHLSSQNVDQAMTEIDKSIVIEAQTAIDNAEHYIDAVLATAQTLDLRTKTEIEPPGEAVITRDMRIDARLSTMLRKPWLTGGRIEDILSITNGVTPETLSADIADLIANDAWLKQLEAKAGSPSATSRCVSRLKLARKILFRLTIAREQRKSLYTHTLCVVIICHYLASRANLDQGFIDNLLVAALCHDMGELYTPPAMLEPGHRITAEERRFIYVHPVTGWLLVRDLPGIAPDVAKATIQHQERLDGSGYPSGQNDSAIGSAGRILAIADVSASIMAHFSDRLRLATLLRLNHRKYDQKFVNLLHEAIDPENAVPGHFDNSKVAKRLAGFANLLLGWSQLRGDPVLSKMEPIRFLSERMYNLRTVVLESGFDPDSLDMPLALATEDATIAAELTAVIDELQFQLADLGHEIARHMPGWQSAMNQQASIAFTNWQQQLNECTQHA